MEPSKEFIARKEFLLHQARRARMKFVLQGRDTIDDFDVSAAPAAQSAGSDNSPKDSATAAKKKAQRNRVPAAECVQDVLDFFHHLLPNEVEAVDVDQLLLSVQDQDLDDDLRNFESLAQNGQQSEYDVFLRKLLVPAASNVVKLLQQFVLSTQARYRNMHTLNPVAYTGFAGKDSEQVKSASANTAPTSAPPTGPLQPEELWDFLDHVCEAIYDAELWNRDHALKLETFVERFVFRKIGDLLLSPLHNVNTNDAASKDEARRNTLTAARIQALQFITPEHLDIRSLQHLANKSDIDDLLKGPIATLMALTTRASPSDKVAVLKSCCQQIALLLKELMQAQQELKNQAKLATNAAANSTSTVSAAPSSTNSTPNKLAALPGADELLPMMILVILRSATHPASPLQQQQQANTSHSHDHATSSAAATAAPTASRLVQDLHSQIRLLQQFTRPRAMLSEAGYLVTQFVSAVYFLEHVDARALMIEPEAFDHAMQSARHQAKRLQQQQQQVVRDKALALKNAKESHSTNNNSSGRHQNSSNHAGDVEQLDLAQILQQYQSALSELDLNHNSSSSNNNLVEGGKGHRSNKASVSTGVSAVAASHGSTVWQAYCQRMQGQSLYESSTTVSTAAVLSARR